jgi:Domain of unknown function (DUF4331)
MRRNKWWLPGLAVAVVSALSLVGVKLHAADHADSPAAASDPDADITDIFAWMSPDGSKVDLILNWFPNAPATSTLAANVLFTFHVSSKATFASSAAATETNIICGFDVTEKLSCWVGSADYVTGAKGQTLTSASGKVKAFAGIKDDPFFLNGAGVGGVLGAVKSAAPSLTFDAAGCPALDASTSMALVNQLKAGMAGAAPTNAFTGQKIQTIVLEVDKSLLTGGGPILGVWGSTNRRG